MTKPAPMKAVKAWAVVRDDGETFGLHFSRNSALSSAEIIRVAAGSHTLRYKYRVIQVLVTPIERKRSRTTPPKGEG